MLSPFKTQATLMITRRLWICALIAIVLLTGFSVESMAAAKSSVMARLASKSLLLAGTSKGVLSVVGERGHVLISNDNADNWTQIQMPTRTMLNGVYFHDDQRGWIVGHEETILRTTDGGKSWTIVNHNPEKEDTPLFDVHFSDAENGFAVGAYGTFMVTTDGGQTWEFQDVMPISADADDDFENNDVENEYDAEDEYSDDGYGDEDDYEEDMPFDYHLNHISKTADGRIFLAAEAGNLLRSDDGGESWISLTMPYMGSFFGSLALDDALLVYGLRGHMYRSEDAGESWQEIETGSQSMLTSGCRLSNGAVVIAGLGGTVLVSSDNGKTFTSKSIIGRQGASSLMESADKALVMTGTFGVKKVAFTELGL